MKNKYFILVLTFLCLLVGQSSYSQDWADLEILIAEWQSDGVHVDIYTNVTDYVDALNHDSNDDNDLEMYTYVEQDRIGTTVTDWKTGIEGDYVSTTAFRPVENGPDIRDGLLDTHNYDNTNNGGNDDDQYPPGDTPPNDDTTNPENPAPENPPAKRIWYLDNDGDGYYISYVLASYKPSGNYKETAIGLDCDDNDATKNLGTGIHCGYKYWYLDNDGDGYYSSYVYQYEKPLGNYKETAIDFDCDDNDASKKNGLECGYKTWYLDADGDGYHSDETVSAESPGEGEGWILTTKGVDCEETDPSITYQCRYKIWYLDTDGDGYHSDETESPNSPGSGWVLSTKGIDCDKNDPTKTDQCRYTMWYFDWDGDGYHSDETEEANSPGSGWVLKTKGTDCDEMDPTKNVYCGNKMWYTDNDNDGWYASIKTAATSPGSGYIDNDIKPTKGQDCDDTKPSQNNICVPIDNCDEIKKQQADPKYQAVMKELMLPKTRALHEETGYWQDKNGDFHKMIAEDSRQVNLPKDKSTLVNVNHVHIDDFILPTGEVVSSYTMPSREDIWEVYNVYDNARTNGLNLGNAYVGTANVLGSFQMRFAGSSNNLSTSSMLNDRTFIMSEANKNAYELAMKKNGDVAGLIIFIRDVLKRTDIALYQIEDNGTSKLELDANNQVKKIPCN